jgi:sucrose phosphorylase
MVTVLDTHDGICMPDVEGIIPEANLQKMIADLESRSGDTIMRRMAGNLHSVGAIYQLTCTFYDALKQNDDAYLGARAIQFFTPGIPQVYYVGLVAGKNDHELVQETGESRDINRHYYTREEWAADLQTSVSQRLLRLMEFRNAYPAFNGVFELHTSPHSELKMVWRDDHSWCQLEANVILNTTVITYLDLETHLEQRLDI